MITKGSFVKVVTDDVLIAPRDTIGLVKQAYEDGMYSLEVEVTGLGVPIFLHKKEVVLATDSEALAWRLMR